LLARRQRAEVRPKAGQPGVGRHPVLTRGSLTSNVGLGLQSAEEFVAGAEALDPARAAVGIRLPLAGLPLWGPEPCLRGVDQLLNRSLSPRAGSCPLLTNCCGR
jgi:hypothetical protein